MGRKLEQVVGRFCERTQIELGERSGDDAFSLSFGDRVNVDLIEEENEVVALYCIVHQYEELPDAETLTLICQANFGCAATGGSSLGLSLETRTVLLTRFWPLGHLDEDGFDRLLGGFVETAEFWIDRLNGSVPEATKQETGQDEASPDSIFSFRI
jgi:Tir chaperone protein (CesT) family